MYLQKINKIEEVTKIVATEFRDWYGIVVHHGAVDNSTLESYARYHIKNRGWSDFGYHFGIDKSGGIYISKYGKKARWKYQRHGAHCIQNKSISGKIILPESANRCCIGIVLEGNFINNNFPTLEQSKSLIKLVNELKLYFRMPINRIYRHDWFTPKQNGCPGKSFDFNMFLASIVN